MRQAGPVYLLEVTAACCHGLVSRRKVWIFNTQRTHLMRGLCLAVRVRTNKRTSRAEVDQNNVLRSNLSRCEASPCYYIGTMSMYVVGTLSSG